MSYEQLTSPNGVERLASVVGPLAPFSRDHTMLMWYRSVSGHVNPADFPTVFYLGDDPQTLYADVVWVGFNGETTNEISLLVGVVTIGNWSGFPPAMQQLGTWVTYVREGNNHKLYINEDVVIEGTQNVSAFPAPTHQLIGTDSFDADWMPHEAAYFREWNKALTREQIIEEINSDVPVFVSGTVTDAPFQVDFDDHGTMGINVPTGRLELEGHKLGGITVPHGSLALAGPAPVITTVYITPPAQNLSLAGQLPVMVIGP